MRCWVSALALVAVAGCSATAPQQAAQRAGAANGALCTAFVDAWVGHFQANVARLDGQRVASLDQSLAQARQALQAAGQDEDACEKPYCIIQPKAGGRLDSYCGYRVADQSGNELYRWVPWTPARR
ncbi:MAG: hypothetical protein IBJ08_21010 [Pseudomonas sp.]|nr:hypothetical protein [Pseudomonas sp.]